MPEFRTNRQFTVRLINYLRMTKTSAIADVLINELIVISDIQYHGTGEQDMGTVLLPRLQESRERIARDPSTNAHRLSCSLSPELERKISDEFALWLRADRQFDEYEDEYGNPISISSASIKEDWYE